MTIAELKAQMMSGKMKDVYLFVGPEIAVRDIYIRQIAKVGNYTIKWVDTPEDVLKSIRANSILQKKTLFILTECAELVKNEKCQQILDMNKGNNMLLCLFTSLDKRVKFYKQYKESIVEFEPLQPEILKKYIKKEIKLSDKDCEKLMEICENDYGRCLLEIDKMKTYIKAFNSKSGFHGYTADDCFYYFIKSGTIYSPPKDAIFDFVDAVMSRNVEKSFRLMQESYDSGEATLVMISNLYNNFKAVLQVQSCRSRDVSNCTGLTGWQITNARKYLHKYSIGELIDAMEWIRKAEVGIKSGTVEEMLAVPQILVNIMG